MLPESWKKKNVLITFSTSVRRTPKLEGVERERMVLGE